MQNDLTYRFKLPVLHWLFLAFLSSCISYQINDSQSSRQLAPIEVVDSLTRNFGANKSADYYSSISIAVFQAKSRISCFQKIQLLSLKLNSLTIAITRFSKFSFLLQNFLQNFRSRNLHSNTSEDHISWITISICLVSRHFFDEQ